MIQEVVFKFWIYFSCLVEDTCSVKSPFGPFYKDELPVKASEFSQPQAGQGEWPLPFSSLFFWVNFRVSVCVLFIGFINPIPIFQQGATTENSCLTQNAYGVVVLSCHLLPSILSGSKISGPSSDCWEFGVGSYSRASKLTGLVGWSHICDTSTSVFPSES